MQFVGCVGCSIARALLLYVCVLLCTTSNRVYQAAMCWPVHV
jgi:hypothetical protein